MKRITITLCLVACVAFGAAAQINKGTVLVGGSSAFGINSSNPDNGAGTSIVNLDLKTGYFVVDNLALGLNLNYLKVSSSSDYSVTSVGLFGRYYVGGKFFLGAGFNSSSSSPGGSSSTQIPLEAGYAAFLTDNIAIEPSLNYIKGDGNSSFGLNLGFSLYFNRTKA